MESSDSSDEELKLLQPKKRLKLDITRCIICQEVNCNKLRSSTEAGLESFDEALKVRQDAVSQTIKNSLGDHDLKSLKIVWHGNCFQSYTSKRNLRFVKPVVFLEEKKCDVDSPRARSRAKQIDWSLCMFCQKVKCKGTRKLMNVSTFDACKTIEEAAKSRNDVQMILQIQDVDLIAAGAMYHKNCRSLYVSKSNLNYTDTSVDCEDDVYTVAFTDFVKEIQPEFKSGKALEMKTLLESYKAILAERFGCTTASSYRSERLKRRLENYFEDQIVFQKQPDPSKPELVYSSSISLQDVINTAARRTSNQIQTSCSPACHESTYSTYDESSTLYHAAQILKSTIKKEMNGINIQPVDLEDLSADKVKSFVPQNLYRFLCLVISNPDKIDGESPAATSDADERHILAIAQDIIHATSHGRVKTPKHVGLAMSVRHMTGSKQLITMLNRLGHCLSYDETERIDTSLALEVLAKSENLGVCIPSNIVPGGFVQVAGDNNDINEETLDGKQTTHATTLVLYQRKQHGPSPKPVIYSNQKEKRRSLDSAVATQDLLEFGAYGKRPEVTSYKDKIKEEWFQYGQSPQRSAAIQMDLGWFLTRLCTNRLLTLELSQPTDGTAQQLLPSWSGFNAKVSNKPPSLTSIGYCPLVNGSPIEYSTIYTLMKNVQAMMNTLEQRHSVITFDLAIYMKVKLANLLLMYNSINLDSVYFMFTRQRKYNGEDLRNSRTRLSGWVVST